MHALHAWIVMLGIFRSIHKHDHAFAQVLQDQNRRGCERQGAARRFPAFVCHISCPPGMLDVTARPDKTAVQFTSWAPVLAAVRAAAMHAWHQYVPLGLLTEWRAHASAPALFQPQEVAQPVPMPAAVAPQALKERTAAEGGSVRQGADAALCGAAGGARERAGPRAHKWVTSSLDGGAAADCMEADLASEQYHAAASRQPRTHGGLEGGLAWLSAPDFPCGGGLPYADKPSAQPDMIHWQETGMASCGLSFRPREERDSGAVHGTDPSVLRRAEGAHPAECKAPEMHELDMADARQDLKDWDSEACDGRDQMAQHTSEEAKLAECRPRCMQEADMTDAWGGMSSPARDLDDLNCQQSPSSAAFAAQLPQSPTLDMPPGARTHTGAQTPMLHRQPLLSFHVRRRPSEPSQLHASLDFKAEARKEDSWCMQPGQAQLNSSSAAADAEYLQPATGSMASPGRQDMAAAHVNWIWTDDGASGELAAVLCTVEGKRQRSVQERNELESGSSAALSHAEQQQRHRGEGSLHEDYGRERNVRVRGSRYRQPGSRRCASSAPAHHHLRMRAARTTPVFSLSSSGGSGDAEHALHDQPSLSKTACPASEYDAQTSGHQPARKRRRHMMQTHSGVCSRPGLADASKADPLQLCNEGPCAVQQRELLGDAVPERSSAPAASHAVEPRMTLSGPTKEKSPDQSAQDKEEDGEAVGLEGGAFLQAPARRRRPQRTPDGSRAKVLASIAGEDNGEPAVNVRSGESVAKLLREWVNPACTSGQRQVPDLASLACGNLLGLVPAAITKESLDTARPLRQVCSIITPLAFKTVRCGCCKYCLGRTGGMSTARSSCCGSSASTNQQRACPEG